MAYIGMACIFRAYIGMAHVYADAYAHVRSHVHTQVDSYFYTHVHSHARAHVYAQALVVPLIGHTWCRSRRVDLGTCT